MGRSKAPKWRFIILEKDKHIGARQATLRWLCLHGAWIVTINCRLVQQCSICTMIQCSCMHACNNSWPCRSMSFRLIYFEKRWQTGGVWLELQVHSGVPGLFCPWPSKAFGVEGVHMHGGALNLALTSALCSSWSLHAELCWHTSNTIFQLRYGETCRMRWIGAASSTSLTRSKSHSFMRPCLHPVTVQFRTMMLKFSGFHHCQ